MLRSPHYVLFSQIAVLFALVLSGCQPGRALTPISGQVSIDGKPLTTGFVMIRPKDHRVAMGKIGSDGRFTIKTKDDEGCVHGEHEVTVMSRKTLKGDATEHYIPTRYDNPKTSGLKIVVGKEKQDNWDIKLTWKGDSHSAPYIEQ
jgi:hypothetical protein